MVDDTIYKLTGTVDNATRVYLEKLQKTLSLKLSEIKEYDEKVAHIANQKINIDLDDGVVVNYSKFDSILSKIK